MTVSEILSAYTEFAWKRAKEIGDNTHSKNLDRMQGQLDQIKLLNTFNSEVIAKCMADKSV